MLLLAPAKFLTVPAHRPVLSGETLRRHEDSLNLTDRAVSIRAPSAASTMVDRYGAFPHAEVAALVAEQFTVVAGADSMAAVEAAEVTAVEAGTADFVLFRAACEL